MYYKGQRFSELVITNLSDPIIGYTPKNKNINIIATLSLITNYIISS